MENLKKVVNKDLLYNNINLKDLAIEYSTPLKVTFLDVIKKRVIELKNSFDKAIYSTNYNGNFIFLNANKANYGLEEIEESFKYSDGLETSSYYDLLLTFAIFLKYNEKDKYIVCNGIKDDNYLNKIVEISALGYKIIDIIDSKDEYLKLKKMDANIEVGFRIHLSSLYSEDGDLIKDDRFGLTEEEFNYCLYDIKNTKMTLSTIHFHQRGFEYEKDKFEKNLVKVFKNYYYKAERIYTSVINFDIGGGTPLPLKGSFDYDEWALYVIKLIQNMSNELGILVPNIISENGKYAQKDSTVNIYKVITTKYTDKDYPWMIVDSSPLIAMPEMYALGEDILVEPINNIGDNMTKVRLGGLTCDCDDVYFEKDKGYILIPDNGTDQYIALIGTGSYQNSMNGKGGVHHCLLPEEKDILIYSDESSNIIKKVRHNIQSIEDIFKLIGLENSNNL